MADLTPERQQAQYAAIELLYSEGQWSKVLEASEALLAELSPLQGHSLRPRLELVIGHTLLYGLADLDRAEARYQAALLETEEPVLREIAAQCLLRCAEQRQVVDGGRTAGAEEIPVRQEPSGEMPTMPWNLKATPTPCGDPGQGAGTGAAMPWLTGRGIEPTATRGGTAFEDTPVSSSVEETLAQLRAPDALIPEEITELAQGLLELVLP